MHHALRSRHYVLDAAHIGGHKLQIRFEYDEIRVVELADRLDGPILEPLKDVSYFKQFHVNHHIDTVVRPNNADFSPYFLYEIGETTSELLDTADAPGQSD